MHSYIVALAITIVVLGYVWVRGRRARQSNAPRMPDRSIVGEAVTAFEDITKDFIGPAAGRKCRFTIVDLKDRDSRK